MKKILFVCHGNICRSPMAEFVLKDMVAKAGLASEFYPSSLAQVLPGCVTCGKFLHLSGLSFLIFQKEMATSDDVKTTIHHIS